MVGAVTTPSSNDTDTARPERFDDLTPEEQNLVRRVMKAAPLLLSEGKVIRQLRASGSERPMPSPKDQDQRQPVERSETPSAASPKQPLRIPPGWKNETAERIGMMIEIVPGPPRGKSKMR